MTQSELGFTYEDLERTVRELATANPDFVYGAQPERQGIDVGCRYLSADGEGNGKGCIMGQALVRLGIDESWLHNMEGHGIAALADMLGIVDDAWGAEARWLSTVQHSQDQGDTWSVAVKTADIFLSGYHAGVLSTQW